MKKTLTIMLVLAMVLSMLPMAFAATTASGTAGNVTWKLTSDGALTISGTGAMPGEGDAEHTPWHAYRDLVRTLTIEKGITNVGTWAFAGFSELQSVSLPEGITDIWVDAFSDCTKLTSIVLPASVAKIWQRAFDGSGLKDITILNKNCEITDYNGVSLESGTIPAAATIHGYAGSTAEAYAKKHNQTFAVLEEVKPAPDNLFTRLKALYEKYLKPLFDKFLASTSTGDSTLSLEKLMPIVTKAFTGLLGLLQAGNNQTNPAA